MKTRTHLSLALGLTLCMVACSSPTFDEAAYQQHWDELTTLEAEIMSYYQQPENPEAQLRYLVDYALPRVMQAKGVLAKMDEVPGLPRAYREYHAQAQQYYDSRMVAFQMLIRNLRHVPPIEWDIQLDSVNERLDAFALTKGNEPMSQ